ncbi:endo alpha-1,4 polygalactosaminidase [Fusobacterium vincentii]|uniref:Endo alpha-1,4 polygalactosaminidase n=4 Tax=Fusobacterium TaxID=848 RepID=A0AAX3MDS7_FUSNU|nr:MULTISPECIES: endo alpha-1,4 polygalactosaminidase [Fusobacterium]QYR57917.1 endo alpha-1,4 polygalactosaminidase [Fusobacterium vincentii]WDA44978.1 endo alpha-1,4 polygalactosaminidase [Fusobacterium nucleatum]
MKKYIFLFLFFISFFSFSKTNYIYRERMKDFIKEIRDSTNKEKIIITQNGNELYFKNGKIDSKFFAITNGTTQESLYYGDVLRFNVPTAKGLKNELLELTVPIRKNGKPIFVINYGKGQKKIDFLKKEDLKTKFVSELLPSLNVDKLYETIEDYNDEDIYSLNEVKNFLCLLNPENFSNIDEYYQALKNTNYDLLLIEVSYNNIFFTEEQIEELKIKNNGGKRLVIAYLSIGEAEDYRFYWNKKWNKKKPNWIVKENENWEGNYIVKYWSPEWKNIIKEYQKKLDEIGVDGYLLDTVDTYQYFEENYKKILE